MRTANSFFPLKQKAPLFSHILFAVISGVFFLGMGSAHAEGNAMAPSPMMPPPASMGALMPPPAMLNGAMDKNSIMDKNVTSEENKVTENAKNLIKTLDASSDALTLDDLNSARQTVARIDAIIDVEKHLAELEKIRGERTGVHAASSLASVIPASALTPPPMKTVEPVFEMPRPVAFSSNQEISRIMGSEGKYSAVLKINGDLKTVRPGDQLPGGATVRYISSSSVVIDENGKTRTLHIKNVDAIYSAMR